MQQATNKVHLILLLSMTLKSITKVNWSRSRSSFLVSQTITTFANGNVLHIQGANNSNRFFLSRSDLRCLSAFVLFSGFFSLVFTELLARSYDVPCVRFCVKFCFYIDIDTACSVIFRKLSGVLQYTVCN